MVSLLIFMSKPRKFYPENYEKEGTKMKLKCKSEKKKTIKKNKRKNK